MAGEAGDLAVGDELVDPHGNWLPVTDLLATGLVEPVYNARIADYHTYFTGRSSADSPWAAWAHNECGPYGKLKTIVGSARNHLNQVAAYGARKVAGGIAYLKGVAHHLRHADHAAFHRSLRAFWRPYQKGGALYGVTVPTNAQYAVALRTALKAAGVQGKELGRLLGLAAAERRAAGFLPHLSVPRVPGI